MSPASYAPKASEAGMSIVSSPPSRSISLGTILSVLVIGAVLPSAILLTLAIWRAGETDRTSATAQFQAQTMAMARMFSSALDANVAVVHAMADLPPIEGSMIDRAREAGSLFNADVATELPSRLFPDTPDKHGDWAVSNLFSIESGVKASVALRVTNAEDPDAAPLTLVMDPRDLVATLKFDLASYGNMLVAIVDGHGRVVARSLDQDRFVGARVPTWNALLAVGADSGVFNAELLEGDSITFAFATIEGTPGWVVVGGMPTAVFQTRWSEPLAYVAMGSAVATVLALIGALFIAQRLAQPVAALARYADATISGTAPEPAASRIAEYETLRRALVHAHATLADRAERLTISENRYRAMAKAGHTITWRRAATGELIDIEGWEEMTGHSSAEMLGTGFARRIHPDDFDHIDKAWHEAVATGGTFDVEARVSPDGVAWRWLRSRGVCLRDTNGTPIEWVGTLEDITTRKERQIREAHLAFHDELTGLPNRGMLSERLERASAASSRGILSALLYIDLDYFKRANDTYGHAAGDALLRLVAERINALLRPSDTPARIGGDEFATLLYDIGGVDDAVGIGLRVVRALSTPFDIGECTIQIGASVGVTLIIGAGERPLDIIKRADAALYEAKGAGRNRCIVYDLERAARRA